MNLDSCDKVLNDFSPTRPEGKLLSRSVLLFVFKGFEETMSAWRDTVSLQKNPTICYGVYLFQVKALCALKITATDIIQ